MAEPIQPRWAWEPYEPTDKNPWDLRKVGHLYRRAAFGANWRDLQANLKAGPTRAIDDLFHGGPGQEEFERETGRLADSIANGGSPRRFRDAQGDRILYLRNKADADALRGILGPGTRLVVIGAGFIGAEVASSARELGSDVTVLEAAPAPLHLALGERLGAACARLHFDSGVDLRTSVLVEGIQQKGEEVVVTTSAGEVVGDVVVVGIGIIPNDEVARASGITVDNGIVVDDHCRTSMENVFAAGDVANHYHPLFEQHMRVEHFDNANKQAAAAANNMLGRDTVFDDPHWFWSDQYGANLQYVGHADLSDDLVIRGNLEEPEWSAFFVRDGVVRAAFAIDRAEDIMVARELITARVPVPADVLSYPEVDLTEMMEEL